VQGLWPRVGDASKPSEAAWEGHLGVAGKESKIEKLLPEGMVKPEKRTEEHMAVVVVH
jgi:hypothetical protein